MLGPQAVAIIKAELEDVKLILRGSLDLVANAKDNMRTELEEVKACLVSTVVKSVLAVVPDWVGDGIESVDTGAENCYVGDGIESVDTVTENCVGDETRRRCSFSALEY